MSQVSYGTITITDTNDIERIYMEYAQSTSNSVAPTSGWSENIPAWQQGYYIWQRTVTKMQGVSLTSDSYGDPVCLTGSTGSQGPQGTQGPQGNTGVGVSSITTTYCNYGTGTPAATYSGWQTTVPAYDSSKPNYWVKTVVNYTDNTSSTPVIYKDNGITSATSTAAAANTTANQANTTANQANETANQANTTAGNALSVANSANDAISDLNQYFWRQKTAATNVPAGSYTTNVPGTTYKSNPANGGFNSLVQSTGIFLRNGITTLSSWTGSALTFYQPGTSNKEIELTPTGLNFYVPTQDSSTNQWIQGPTGMSLTSDGVKIYNPVIGENNVPLMNLNGSDIQFLNLNGDIQAKFGENGAEIDYLKIDSGATLGTSSPWEINPTFVAYHTGGTYYYNSIIGYDNYITNSNEGKNFIQLSNKGYWRLSRNRIHTGWYDTTATSDKTKINYIIFSDTYYDYGFKAPTGLTDKFIYLRKSTASVRTQSPDSDTNWTYQFWVDGEGNVHAPGFYIGNSTTPIGGGAGTVAERLTQGYGSATQPVYFNSNGVPTNTTYTLNAAGAKGVDTSISASSTSTNLPTSQAVAAFVEGKGYITSYVDEKVKVTNANTTKLWVTGTATSGTSTGTLSYDTNVYITTTSGTLHATTFDGTSFTGTAAKATADADGNAIKTTYLKLSGGQVTGPVSFGSSVTIDEATVGDLVVNGNASFTNNINANTINGVAVGSSPKFTDTTYTFANGTNGFTVTPSGGTAQTVTVTPSISNNVTGSGTSGYLVKWNGVNTVTNGPALGSDTTKFLNNKGEWAVPGGTYSLGVATYNTLGGVKPAYSSTGAVTLTTAAATNISTPTIAAKSTTSDRYYAIEIDKNGVLFVNVPWTNVNSSYLTSITSTMVTNALGFTPYNSSNPNGYTTNTGTVTSVKVQGSNGLTGSGTVTTSGTITLSHDDTSSQTSSSNSGRTYIQSITLDDYGHVTGLSTATETVTDTHNTAYLYAGASNGTANATTTNGNTYLILVDGGSVTTRRKIAGSGTVEVKSDNNGNITITGSAHPTTLPNPKTLTIRAYNSTSTTVSYSDSTYYGGENSNTTISVASTNAVTNISSNNSGQLILTRADGSQSDPITVKITATTSDTAASADKLNISTDVGSTSVPVYFPANTGLPTAVTSIAYSLLPTGTTASTVAIGNHSHGNITSGGDITASAPTVANGDQLVINDHSASKITNGPTFDGSTTTAFLTKAGTWATPAGTYTLPLAANGTRGGVQIGYTTSGKNYAVQLSSEKMYVNVPWENTTYSAGTGLSLSGTTFSNTGVTGVKGNSESSYRTGQVNLTYDNVGAIGANVNGNTRQLLRPVQMNGCNDNTLDQKISFLRANRLMFLPADQIIIEKTTDGGTTWVDAGYTDTQKRHLFAETQGAGISVPLLNGARSTQCGLRITITGMKYNVPDGTAETAKYNYWNSNYVKSQERYCQLKEIYFWVSTANAGLSCKIERATGAASTTWAQIYDSGSTFALTGWSGNDYVRFSQSVFGGGTTQTSNYWNYRFTFFQRSSTGTTTLPDTYTTSAGTLYEIRGYGDTSWSTTAVSHQFMNNDHIYKWDLDKNTTFPAQVTATQFNGSLNGNATTATTADRLMGFTGSSTSIGWGNQAGTPVMVMNDSTGGSIGFRRDNPSSGQVSMVIDGTVYVKEGQVNVSDAIKTITRSGTTFTYTTLWGNTGTFTQQDNDTWNALSTSQAGYVAQAPNDTSKFLRGDASWAAVTKANVGLGNVENTALSTWTGSSNITTVGTISSGTWSGTTIAVNKGGTGVTTLASGELLVGNGTGAVTTRAIRNNVGAGTLGWTSSTADTVIPTVNTIAYWNGAYSGTSSNLAYCQKGAFGTAATYTASTSVGNNSYLPTGAAIQTYVSGVVGNYVTLNTEQTITASQKTFNGAIRWGTASKYGAAHYDSTLEAIVFSFV